MFVPLFNMVGYYVLQQSTQIRNSWSRFIYFAFAGMTGIAVIMIAGMLLDEQLRALPGILFVWIFGSIAILLCFFSLMTDQKRSFLWFAITLLVIRSVFDLVVIPIRKTTNSENWCREDCIRVASKYGDRKWYIYGQTETHEVARFYTSAYTDQIIHHTESVSDTSAYYLVDLKLYPAFQGILMDSLMLEKGQRLALMRVQ
jgi:hypothetical protein